MAALLISISLIDLLTHRIPNRLVVLIPLVSITTLHIHSLYFFGVFFLGVLVIFGVSDIGAGDVKLALVCLTVVSDINVTSFFLGFCLGALIAFIATKILAAPNVDHCQSERTRIALGPALALAFLANM